MEANMDAEIQAMGQIAEALESLDVDTRRRVLKWAAERYQPKVHVGSASIVEAMGTVTSQATHAPHSFLTVHQLFDAAAPQTGLEKVLVVAYWFQVVQGQADWDSQTVNSELKQMGHPSSNITRDMDSLMSRTPRLVMQTRKQGVAKQARKLFTLTREGTKSVEAMLKLKDDLMS
jgi:hypothetical protein